MLNESAPRIRTDVQVMFFDTDCAAVVHNLAYLRFIEVARTQFVSFTMGADKNGCVALSARIPEKLCAFLCDLN